ncbi:50S ribosomal protein L22 [Cellulomonas endophytica]|uniref:50S ribosomal protein L22 n=1 Tax=Cellulomonas endophytica TaxID=2494735 RepID=UPI00101043AF|nr:50S ribosomal protein L22 [Cellulomonas endophytica]
MEAKAKARFVRVTPQKARRVVDLVRGKGAGEAVSTLRFAPQTAGQTVLKVVESAIANARQTAARDSVRFDEGDLYIAEAYVDEGPTLKRFRPRAQGRAGRILKRTSHITVVVASRQEAREAARAKATTKGGAR